jgi:hypothetical protein
MSDEKSLPTKGKGGDIQLHDNGLRAGSLIDQSLRNLDQQQAQHLMAKAAEEALRLEVKNREQNMDYVVGKKAAEDHIDTFNMLEKGGRMTRQSVTSDIKTGAGNLRIESRSGATCFVASVAYGDPNHPDVMFLRSYRDSVLTLSRNGRVFISWYYENGPKLAHVVRGSAVLKGLSRVAISVLVRLLRLTNRRFTC